MRLNSRLLTMQSYFCHDKSKPCGTRCSSQGVKSDEIYLHSVVTFDMMEARGIDRLALKWKEHVAPVSVKVSRVAGMIKHAKKFLPTETSKLLYRELTEPHLRFCCFVWGNCGVSTRRILERLRNRSVRIVTNSPYDAPVEVLLKRLLIV